MALESANYVAGLVETNPIGNDQRSTADDHLRLIKRTLKNSFPQVASAISATSAELNFLMSASANLQDQLNAKLNKAGGTVSGSLQVVDVISASAAFADIVNVIGNNAQVRLRDADNAVVGAGNFAIKAGSTSLVFYSADDNWSLGPKIAELFHSAGAVFYFGGAERLRTNAEGVKVSGIVSATTGISAVYANSSSFSVSANHASSAVQANSAVFATQAGFAASANNCLSAAYAASAGFAAQATYADQGPSPTTTQTGHMRAATNDEASAQSSTNIAITPANLATILAMTKSANGSMRIGDFILNWGSVSTSAMGGNTTRAVAVTFSRPFPHAYLCGGATVTLASYGMNMGIVDASETTTGMNIFFGNGTGGTFALSGKWWALGY